MRWQPDPTFYPSPKMAIEAPVEKLAFVTMLNPSLTGRCDAMGVIDPDPETKSNGKMARRVTMPDASAERRLERPRASAGLVLLAVLLGTTCMNLRADSITIGGTINQSTQDGTGPAVNNPSLNAALDGASYTIDLSFAGSITSLGAYDLTGRSLIFSAADAGVLEDSFNVRRRLRSGRRPRLFDDRLRLCQGNQLDLLFMIPSVQLNSQSVMPRGISGIIPLDLLEDDGVTDIHASVTRYSYAPAAAVPELSAFVMLASGFIAIALKRRVGSSRDRIASR